MLDVTTHFCCCFLEVPPCFSFKAKEKSSGPNLIRTWLLSIILGKEKLSFPWILWYQSFSIHVEKQFIDSNLRAFWWECSQETCWIFSVCKNETRTDCHSFNCDEHCSCMGMHFADYCKIDCQDQWQSNTFALICSRPISISPTPALIASLPSPFLMRLRMINF